MYVIIKRNKTNDNKYISFISTQCYILFNTIRSQCNVCNRCAGRELNLLVGKITHFHHQSSCELLINVTSRFKRQGQTLIGKHIHAQFLQSFCRFFARFFLDYTRSVDHLYFSRIDDNITLAQQLYSVFYKGQKMIGHWFREELLQIVILLHIGNHIFRHVVTLLSACKLR